MPCGGGAAQESTQAATRSGRRWPRRRPRRRACRPRDRHACAGHPPATDVTANIAAACVSGAPATRVGPVPGWPVIDMIPLTAWTISSPPVQVAMRSLDPEQRAGAHREPRKPVVQIALHLQRRAQTQQALAIHDEDLAPRPAAHRARRSPRAGPVDTHRMLAPRYQLEELPVGVGVVSRRTSRQVPSRATVQPRSERILPASVAAPNASATSTTSHDWYSANVDTTSSRGRTRRCGSPRSLRRAPAVRDRTAKAFAAVRRGHVKRESDLRYGPAELRAVHVEEVAARRCLRRPGQFLGHQHRAHGNRSRLQLLDPGVAILGDEERLEKLPVRAPRAPCVVRRSASVSSGIDQVRASLEPQNASQNFFSSSDTVTYLPSRVR